MITQPTEPAEAIEAAHRLEQEGDHRAGIDLLTAANRLAPHLEIEQELLELRNRAFYALDSSGLDEWPPPIDPVAPTGKIPEIDRDDLTVDALRNGIIGQGALLVRRLLDPEKALELAAGIDRAEEAAAAFENKEATPDTLRYFRRFKPEDKKLARGRKFVRDGRGVWTADSPHMFFTVIEMLHQVGFIDIVKGYIGEPAVISVNKSTLRVVPPDSGTNWHQDGAFLGDDIRSCNLWLALSHCGVDAPSLDVVPRRLDRIVETGTNGAFFDWSVGPGTVDQLTTDSPVTRPVFEPGDALLFDDLNLHRTGVGEGMTKERYAIESWFFGASNYPPGVVPLLV